MQYQQFGLGIFNCTTTIDELVECSFIMKPTEILRMSQSVDRFINRTIEISTIPNSTTPRLLIG